MRHGWDATFSLVCRCPDSGDLAVAVCTARPAVGSRVPFAAPGSAAVASQAKTNPGLGYAALAAIRAGCSAQEAMEKALAGDPGREARQFSVIDATGRHAVFTGAEVLEQNTWAGSALGRDCVAAGNLLVGPEVIRAMVDTFEGSYGFLGERALMALEAGQAAGGDKRGKISAALLVARAGEEHPLLDLRVDRSEAPVADLRLLYTDYLGVFPLPEAVAPGSARG